MEVLFALILWLLGWGAKPSTTVAAPAELTVVAEPTTSGDGGGASTNAGGCIDPFGKPVNSPACTGQ